jgi:hypothetical protein
VLFYTSPCSTLICWHKLLLCCCCYCNQYADVTKLKQQTLKGQVKDRYKPKGCSALNFRVQLGMEMLPDSLTGDGCLLLQAGDQFLAYYRDSTAAGHSEDELPEQFLALPALGQFDMQPVNRSGQSQASTAASSPDLVSVVSDAFVLVSQGQADLIRASPFVKDDSAVTDGDGRMDLQRVLDVVSATPLGDKCKADATIRSGICSQALTPFAH